MISENIELTRQPVIDNEINQFIKHNSNSGMSTPPSEISGEDHSWADDLQKKLNLLDSNHELFERHKFMNNKNESYEESKDLYKSTVDHKERDTEGDLSENQENTRQNRTSIDFGTQRNLNSMEAITFDDAVKKEIVAVHKGRLSQVVPEPIITKTPLKTWNERDELEFHTNPIPRKGHKKISLLAKSLSSDFKDDEEYLIPKYKLPEPKHSQSYIQDENIDINPNDLLMTNLNQTDIKFKIK